MLIYAGMLLLVMAVSLDGLGVGITYGMRKIKVPFIAILIIMICSGCIVYTSMTIGELLSNILSTKITSMLGGSILIFLGIFSLINIFRSKNDSKHSEELHDPSKLENLKTVMSTPDNADLDKSGVISVGEAFLLGLALALDAFGAGIGAAMLGYPPFTTAILTAVMSGLFLKCGIQLGSFLSKNQKLRRLSFLPPAILISIGVLNLFG
ncbi:sporulation membrane protein YtaF [Oceanobacillus iheyensis]|uniref:sporulation membrane protein YtaF n=1 Tax=Oceanobacillus iheyensis TaxID=182710 RepID=UPI0036431B7E